MSFELIPSPQDCCKPCPSPLVENIPGPQGAAGAAGASGTNGVNAYTTLTASFTMPAEGANVTATVANANWAVVGENVAVGKFGSAAFGTFQVVQVISTTSVSLKNIKDTASGAYAGNSAPGTAFPSASTVGPSGLQGPTGSAPGGIFMVSNNLSEGVLATKQANLGIGTAGAQAVGAFFQVANNLSEGVGATKRTNLGLGSAAVLTAGVANANLPPVDTTFTNGDAVFATASGLQTKTPSNARLALGIGGMVGAYVLCQFQQPNNTAGGSFTSGSWIVVPMNTKVSDPSGIATLAANVLTLPTGSYRIRASVLGHRCGTFQSRLFNVSDAAVEFYGSVVSADTAAIQSNNSLLECRLVVTAGPKNYRLEAQCSNTQATNGLGLQGAFGGTEVYSSWELEQEA